MTDNWKWWKLHDKIAGFAIYLIVIPIGVTALALLIAIPFIAQSY